MSSCLSWQIRRNGYIVLFPPGRRAGLNCWKTGFGRSKKGSELVSVSWRMVSWLEVFFHLNIDYWKLNIENFFEKMFNAWLPSRQAQQTILNSQRKGRMQFFIKKRLSQMWISIKIIIAPTLKPACRRGRGVMIFSDFLPLGKGQEVGENR